MTLENKRVLKKMRTGAKKPRENLKKTIAWNPGNENVHFFLPGRVVARWGSGSDSANSATKIILGHARAHVSSPDLVTHTRNTTQVFAPRIARRGSQS